MVAMEKESEKSDVCAYQFIEIWQYGPIVRWVMYSLDLGATVTGTITYGVGLLLYGYH
jgi:hypothetical protein